MIQEDINELLTPPKWRQEQIERELLWASGVEQCPYKTESIWVTLGIEDRRAV